ncbi:telomerase Cajal body protein 1 [Galendromus occidentalis]|uniref:WD repeat-containing protein 79 n=1 Tax=Galendromus occidentalis TaxID=34638 RepID=A0AAJ7L5E7_9ACAR|nr:telomerase Cajal body protein 1 [Galendromus occidentalis]
MEQSLEARAVSEVVIKIDDSEDARPETEPESDRVEDESMTDEVKVMNEARDSQSPETCPIADEAVCPPSQSADVGTYNPPRFDVTPTLVYTDVFENFTKGVKWASNGVNFAVVTDDNQIHSWKTVEDLGRYFVPDKILTERLTTIREPQPINDFAWHPAHDRSSFVTTCNTQPLHLYDATTGKLLCSYVAKNHLDELVAAYSVQFLRSGEKVCAGYKKFVRIFEVEYCGRSTEVSTWKQYQAGIVSAIDASEVADSLMAVGTYCNSVALYDLRTGKISHDPVVGHKGGITQLRMSADGGLLYSGARKDNVIQCRDLRKFEEVLYEFPRVCTTNQRMHFDLCYEEDYLCTGNTDGSCYLWDLRNLKMYEENKCEPNLIFLPHTDLRKTRSSAANGISFHPWAPLLASSSGGRSTTVWDEETEQCLWTKASEYAVKLWKFPC